MTQTVSCIYDARADADAAAAELLKTGFPEDEIFVVAAGEASDEELHAAIEEAGLRDQHAEFYSEALRNGATLVAVPAQFGCAGLVNRILQKHGPIATGLPEQGYEQRPRDPAAPLSSAWGWPVLLDDTAPFSTWLGLRALTTDPPVRKRRAKLVRNPAPFSRAINAPVLSDKPTILSSKYGWRVLWDNPAPLSSRFGWPVLSKSQKPGPLAPKLLDDPAPFSGLLSMKQLSSDPAPFSRLLGWRVLSNDPKPKAAPGA